MNASQCFWTPFWRNCLIFDPVLAPTGFKRGPNIDYLLNNPPQIRKDTSQKGGVNKHDLLIDFGCQSGRPEMIKKRFSYYTCCKLRNLGARKIYNLYDQIASKRVLKLKPWPSNIWFFKIWIDLGKFVFSMFWGTGKNKQQKQILSEFWIQIMIQRGPLSSGLACFSRHYILFFDNARHRPVSADLGAHWVLKGCPNWQFSHKTHKSIHEGCGCFEKH